MEGWRKKTDGWMRDGRKDGGIDRGDLNEDGGIEGWIDGRWRDGRRKPLSLRQEK